MLHHPDTDTPSYILPLRHVLRKIPHLLFRLAAFLDIRHSLHLPTRLFELFTELSVPLEALVCMAYMFDIELSSALDHK